VVDFRQAPSVQDLVAKVSANDQATQGAQNGAKADTSESTDTNTQTVGINAALVPSTAGRVVYYRVN
ncbi:MAG TPA: hypothetical protein VMG12_43960, partial [Polyangiaceae bacterium]|nr:hypothetical protein [Polyangiaceae bacterium]